MTEQNKQTQNMEVPKNEQNIKVYNNKKNKDTYSYQGWLNSDSFLKRALAVTGYSIVGTLIGYITLGIVAIIFFVVFGAFFSAFG